MTGDKKKKIVWAMIPALLAAAMTVGIFTLGNPDEALSGDFTITILAVATAYSLFTFWSIFTLDDKVLKENPKGKGLALVLAVLIFALIIRIYMGLMITGYASDMSCWTAWSHAAAGKGLFEIYSDMSFIDYPPGYVYILHILGSIGNLTGMECGSAAYNLLLKMPSIIADLIMAWIIYRICAKRLRHTMGLILAFLYALNPMVMLDSAAWGQIDAILALALAGYLIALYKENFIGATLFFVAGLLIKPQMLFFGPVLAVVFIKYIANRGWGKAMKTFAISLFSGLGLFVLTVLPFTGNKEWYWIFEKYIGTIGSYNFITLNSANIYGMFGLNWMPIETVKWGLTLGVWGIIGIAATVVVYFVLGFLNKDRKNIFMLTVMLMTGIYTFGLKMHERYLFPVIVVMIIAYIYDNKDSILAFYSVLTAAVFINMAQVLAVIHIPPDDLIFRITSGVMVAAYIGIVVFCFIEVAKSIKESKINLMEESDKALGFKNRRSGNNSKELMGN